MGNIITFAEDYRLKDFREMPFGIVDSLILSQLSYYNYTGSSFEKNIWDKKLCTFYQERPDIIIKGMLTAAGDEKLIKVLAQGGRHGDLRACRYVEEYSAECEKQFAAITLELGNGEYYIAFRGTDNSVVGWKEDFALSFQEMIPAQEAAMKYAEETMLRFPGIFYLGGHSKGGNLAVCAAMNLPETLQKRVKAVYNFDGPGFLGEVYRKSGYASIRSRINKIVPGSSVIGMMLEEEDNYKVVCSTGDTLLQHDPYRWQVDGMDFRYKDSIDSFSEMVKCCLTGWLDELSLEERKKIVNTVFDVIYKTGINSFYELTEQKFEKIRALLEGVSDIEPEEKKRVHMAVKRLLSISAEELRRAAREESTAQFARSAAQLEKSAAQVEKFLQSIQRGDWNKKAP